MRPPFTSPEGPATVQIFIDDRPVGSMRLAERIPGRFGKQNLDVGTAVGRP